MAQYLEERGVRGIFGFSLLPGKPGKFKAIVDAMERLMETKQSHKW